MMLHANKTPQNANNVPKVKRSATYRVLERTLNMIAYPTDFLWFFIVKIPMFIFTSLFKIEGMKQAMQETAKKEAEDKKYQFK